MAKVTVKLTLLPDPVEVDESELPGLRSQGLLVDEKPAKAAKPTPTPPAASAAPAAQ